MYTILVNQDNSLTVSVRERIMQRSKLVNTLHFLVEPNYVVSDYSGYNDGGGQAESGESEESNEETVVIENPIIDENGIANMSRFTVLLEYVLPTSKKYCSEILVKTVNEDGTDKLYKDRLEYKLPFDTSLTSEAGDIKCKLTFTAIDLDENDNSKQYVRKTSDTTIHITPISAWCDIVPDEALNVIDQRIIRTDAQIRALEELNGITATSKADNIVLDAETNDIYLTANGEKIGNSINMNDLGESLAEGTTNGLINVII